MLDSEAPDTVYVLAQRGSDLMANGLGIDRKLVRCRQYPSYVDRAFVEHCLAVNDVRVVFTVGARAATVACG